MDPITLMNILSAVLMLFLAAAGVICCFKWDDLPVRCKRIWCQVPIGFFPKLVEL